MNDDEIKEKIRAMRRVAEPVGPLHGYWDLISDADELLKGRQTRISRTELETALAKVPSKPEEWKLIADAPDDGDTLFAAGWLEPETGSLIFEAAHRSKTIGVVALDGRLLPHATHYLSIPTLF